MKKKLAALFFALLLLVISPGVSYGRIVFDATGPGGYFVTLNGSNYYLTVTTTPNPIVFVSTFGKAPTPTDSVTAVTFASTSMTKVTSTPTLGPDGRWETLWCLAGAPSGKGQVVISATGDGASDAVSYAGAAQTCAVDAFTTNANAGSGTGITTTLASIADNSWMVMAARNENGSPAAGTGSTLRINDVNGNGMYDSGALITPPASYSMQITTLTPTFFAVVMASFAPAVTSTVATSTRRIRGSGITR